MNEELALATRTRAEGEHRGWSYVCRDPLLPVLREEAGKEAAKGPGLCRGVGAAPYCQTLTCSQRLSGQEGGFGYFGK